MSDTDNTTPIEQVDPAPAAPAPTTDRSQQAKNVLAVLGAILAIGVVSGLVSAAVIDERRSDDHREIAGDMMMRGEMGGGMRRGDGFERQGAGGMMGGGPGEMGGPMAGGERSELMEGALERAGTSREELHAAMREEIEQQVKDGTLTEEQGDAMLERLELREDMMARADALADEEDASTSGDDG
jgi:hypothetical protein